MPTWQPVVSLHTVAIKKIHDAIWNTTLGKWWNVGFETCPKLRNIRKNRRYHFKTWHVAYVVIGKMGVFGLPSTYLRHNFDIGSFFKINSTLMLEKRMTLCNLICTVLGWRNIVSSKPVDEKLCGVRLVLGLSTRTLALKGSALPCATTGELITREA